VVDFVPEPSQTRRAAVFLNALRQNHLFAVAESLCVVRHPRHRLTRPYLRLRILVQPFIRPLHQLPATNDYATLNDTELLMQQSGMDTGRVDPRVGSGRVRILGKFGGSGRVKISEMQYVNFAVFVVFLIEVVMKNAKLAHQPN